MFQSISRLVRICGQYAGAIQPYTSSTIAQSKVACFVPFRNMANITHQEGQNSWKRPLLSSHLYKTTSLSFFEAHSSGDIWLQQPSRSAHYERKIVMEKGNIKDGKRTTVDMVPERFFRLDWGMWIRRIAGCHRKVWAKNTKRFKRSRQHVMCTAKQCRLLDKMVAPYWREPKYYVDDPYAPYHKREDFYDTRRTPVDIPPRL